jgi:hypothetical protein
VDAGLDAVRTNRLELLVSALHAVALAAVFAFLVSQHCSHLPRDAATNEVESTVAGGFLGSFVLLLANALRSPPRLELDAGERALCALSGAVTGVFGTLTLSALRR